MKSYEKEKDYILGLYFSGVTVGNIRKYLKEENMPVPAAITLYGYTSKAQKLIDSGERTVEEMTAIIPEDKRELVESLRTRSRGEYKLKNKVAKNISKSHMHGPDKLANRESVRDFANSHMSSSILNGLCVSLPWVNMMATMNYFDKFNAINDTSHYVFFEANKDRVEEVATKWRHLPDGARERSTLVMGDIVDSSIFSVPDNSVVTFDLDFMCTADEIFMKSLVTLMVTKGSEEYYAFINNSVRGGGGYEKTTEMHRAMIESMEEYYGKNRVKFMMHRYSDSSPMLTTSIVVKKGENS